jgi:uncharacterized protein YbcI
LQPLHEKYPSIVPELDDLLVPSIIHPDYRTSHLFFHDNHHQTHRHFSPRRWKRRLLHNPAAAALFRPLHGAYNNNNNNNNNYSLAAAAASIPVVGSTAAAGAGPSFWKYLLVFTAGGLFFSSAIAAAYAITGLGMENVKRIVDIIGLVLQRVWISFTVGLGATKMALLGKDHDDDDENDDGSETMQVSGDASELVDLDKADMPPETEAGGRFVLADTSPLAKDSSGTDEVGDEEEDKSKKKPKGKLKWGNAWTVLKKQLAETKRTATEGFKAMRQEKTLYTALVGQQGLVPIQYAVAKLLPFSVTTVIENAIRDTLKNIKPSKVIKKMTLKNFSAGRVPPAFVAARAYDVENAIAIDFDVKWASEVEATFIVFAAGGFAKFPVSIKDLKFSGVIRMILTPLTQEPPGYGALLVSFPTPPQLSLDVKILGGEVTKVPFLRREITSALQKSIQEELLWPRRNVVPMLDKGKQILDRADLQKLARTDPFLELEQVLAKSNEPMVKDIRERLQAKDDLDSPFINILDELENASGTNVTDATSDQVLKQKRNNWFGRFSSKKKSQVFTGDAVLNVTKIPTEEEVINRTASEKEKYSIEAQLSTVFESITKWFEELVESIIGPQNETQSENTTAIGANNSGTSEEFRVNVVTQ